ncbi:MAG: hypothetical protein A3C35_01320 [Omnitrophica bacterium RIFCSPHIGHO2_02_FULL_46_11]|nr:MAG: hypothetical protein A3C35_01320 [Omnitrophica bacterium RIFCSPHIGHO2_02_FULL_46_11]OGW87070.1 MAG: hypothetical protein A3A81_00565 [Omnitrophica bacterium RIFCSPLOWO2_01_FULL_45_10b]
MLRNRSDGEINFGLCRPHCANAALSFHRKRDAFELPQLQGNIFKHINKVSFEAPSQQKVSAGNFLLWAEHADFA